MKHVWAIIVCTVAAAMGTPASAQELLPQHVTPASQKAVNAGLEYLVRTQSPEGNWTSSADGVGYPVAMASLAGMALLANGNTTTRGPYAEAVAKVRQYVMSNTQSSGLICSGAELNGRSMYAHGFALLFLSEVYGMETDPRVRTRLKRVITDAIALTARGQSNMGGWTYIPGGGDEGSVTVTQIQGLRAASNAGFTIPKGTIEDAVRYLELCKTSEGGIRYSLSSGDETRLPISAAAIATLYNAGEYDSRLADDCLAYVTKQLSLHKGWNLETGHDYYTHLYASQALYQAGDKYWDDYFPPVRDELIRMQSNDGSWPGDSVGPVFGTSVSLIILQLPYKFLPIYQR